MFTGPLVLVLHYDALCERGVNHPRLHVQLPKLFQIAHVAKIPVHLIGEMRLLAEAVALSEDHLQLHPDRNDIQGQILEIRWSATPPIPDYKVWYLDTDQGRRHAAQSAGAYAFGHKLLPRDTLGEFVQYLTGAVQL